MESQKININKSKIHQGQNDPADHGQENAEQGQEIPEDPGLEFHENPETRLGSS